MYKLLCGLIIMLSGCSLTSAPRPYDPVEYYLSTSLTVNATRALHRCNDVNVNDKEFWKYFQLANTNSFELSEFISNKKDSERISIAIENTRSLVTDVLKRGNFSPSYCIHKVSNIQASSRIVSRALGKAERFNLCDNNIKTRFNLFAASYNEKKLTKEEYKELVEDLVKLAKIDSSSCDESVKSTMREDLQLLEKALSILLAI